MRQWQLAPVVDGKAIWDRSAQVRGPFWPIRDLTRRQRQVLLFMLRYHERTGAAPSVSQIADGVRLASISTVVYHLTRLQRAGWVERAPRRHAAARVVAPVELEVVCEPLVISP